MTPSAQAVYFLTTSSKSYYKIMRQEKENMIIHDYFRPDAPMFKTKHHVKEAVVKT